MPLSYPALETQDGELVTETPAICSLLSAMGSAPHLCGADILEQAQVDQWMSFMRQQTLPLAKALSGAVYGTVDMTTEEHTYISNLLKENVKLLNNQLKSKQWFCGGENATIADYMMIVSLAELEQCVMDTNLRNSLNNMNNHFKKVAALDEVRGVLGNLKQGKKQVQATCLTKKKEPAAAEKSSKKQAKKK